MWSVIRRGTRGLNLLVRGCIQQKRKVQTFWLTGRAPHPNSVGHPDLPIMKTLRRVVGLFTVMILKIVSESIFFQNKKFTACKIKDGKDVANSLMVFNLLKIIHPSQVKKHVRTWWKLNCNPQKFVIGYWQVQIQMLFCNYTIECNSKSVFLIENILYVLLK